MRRRDKSKNIERANLLAEQRYLESKGLLTEGTESTNWDEVLTRNLTDPSSDLFTFDFNGKRTTLRVTRVNKISFDNIKFLHIDVQLEPNNIVGDTQTIVVGKNAKDVFLPSKGNTGELELVGNSKSWLFAVKQSMLKQKSQQQDDTINESPWNGDPNSNWVPGDDDMDIEVTDVGIYNAYSRPVRDDAHREFDSLDVNDEMGFESILDSIGIVFHGSHCKPYHTTLANIVEPNVYNQLGKYKAALHSIGKSLSTQPSNKEINVSDEIMKVIYHVLDNIVKFNYDIEWDCEDDEPDEDLMPGGKYDRMDEGAVNKSGIKKSSKRIKITESQHRLLKSKGLLKEEPTLDTDVDVSATDNHDLCDELTINSEEELRDKMRGMTISKEDKVKIEGFIEKMNDDNDRLGSDLDVNNTYLRLIQNMLCTFEQDNKENIDESGMAHAAGFADGGSGFEEGATMMQDNGDVLKEDSDTYFETLSATLDHVREMAKEMGYELDEDDVNFQFGTGGIPYGQTKSATIPLLKDGEPIMGKSGKPLNRAIRVSIYRMDSGRYELTAYKTF